MSTSVDGDGSRRKLGLVLWVLSMVLGALVVVGYLGMFIMGAKHPSKMPLHMAIGAVIAFPACLVYLRVPKLIDRYNPEPRWALTVAFLWGMVATLAGGVFNQFLLALVFRQEMFLVLYPTIFGPIGEELFKGIFVLGALLFMRREFDGVVDGVVYASFVALGFATIENVIYYGGALDQDGARMLVGSVLMRGVATPWMHPVYTSMTGIGLGIARETSKTWLKFVAPVAGFCAACTLHIAWNGGLHLLGELGSVVLLVFAVVCWLLFAVLFGVVVFFLVRREGKIIREHLQDEVSSGNLSREEIDMVCAPLGRLKALREDAVRRRFIDAAARLGLSRWHASRRTDPGIDLAPLRDELAQARAQLQSAGPRPALPPSGNHLSPGLRTRLALRLRVLRGADDTPGPPCTRDCATPECNAQMTRREHRKNRHFCGGLGLAEERGMTLRKTLPSPRVSPFASRERASGREGRLALTFPEKLPPLWYCGSPLGTAVAQAFLVVLPAGERMFIRSVRRYLLQTEDRALRKQIHAFCAQEGHHGAEHVRLSRVIAAQGPHVDAFATRVEGALTRLERTLPSLLLLSMTAAFEHYTAVFAERGLRGDFLSRCPEEIQLLMQWHCAEEIEHKCVAFDVLQQQSQSYLLRAAGFLLSTLMLLVVAVLGGALFFMRGPATPRGWLRSERALWAEQRRSVKKGQFLAYLRPGYHPSQDDSFGLARRWAEAQAAG